MKKIPQRKLSLTAETVRKLQPLRGAELRQIRGGGQWGPPTTPGCGSDLELAADD